MQTVPPYQPADTPDTTEYDYDGPVESLVKKTLISASGTHMALDTLMELN